MRLEGLLKYFMPTNLFFYQFTVLILKWLIVTTGHYLKYASVLHDRADALNVFLIRIPMLNVRNKSMVS